MSMFPRHQRLIVVGLMASTLVALAAPAMADHRRYKGVQSSAPQRVYIRDRSSNVGPVLAGIVGGFILGTAVTSNAHPTVVHQQSYCDEDDCGHTQSYSSYPDYRYYDPYGDDWYDSLDECQFVQGGPQVVFVVDVHNGRRLSELQYRYGRWNRCNDGYYASWAHARGHRCIERRWSRDDDDRRDRWSDGRRYRNDDGRRYRGDDDRRRGHDRDDD